MQYCSSSCCRPPSRSHQFSASLSFMCNLFVWLTSSSSRHRRGAARVCVSPGLFCAVFCTLRAASPPRQARGFQFGERQKKKKGEKGGTLFRRRTAPLVALRQEKFEGGDPFRPTAVLLKPSGLSRLLGALLFLISVSNDNRSPVLAGNRRGGCGWRSARPPKPNVLLLPVRGTMKRPRPCLTQASFRIS